MADNTKRYIAVDLGVSDGKVVLASVTGGTVTTETLHSFSIPPVRIDGQDYWDIYAAYSGVLLGLKAAGARKLPVESIGIDAWGPGVVCLGKDGSFLGLPCLYGDVLTEPAHTRFFKRMDRRELYETAGVNVLDSHAALQLYALRRARSIALDAAKYVLFIPDALAYLLTGKRCCGFTSLSASGLMDRKSGKVSRDIMSACKVRPRRIPSVVHPGSKAARLSEEAAQATGLNRVPVMAVAGHRLASAAAALDLPNAGTSSSENGAAFLLTGATSILGIGTASPIVNDQTYEMNFSNEAGVSGANLLVKRIAGTDLLDRCMAAWSAAGRAYSPEDVARMVREGGEPLAQLDPEDPALLSLFASPFFDPVAAVGRYCSIRSMTAPSDDAGLIHLIYSSIAEKVGDTFTKLQSVTPFRIKALNVVGEMSADAVLCQMIADECAVPVTAGPAEVAVLGNVLVQAGGAQAASGQPALAQAGLASLSASAVTYTPGL